MHLGDHWVNVKSNVLPGWFYQVIIYIDTILIIISCWIHTRNKIWFCNFVITEFCILSEYIDTCQAENKCLAENIIVCGYTLIRLKLWGKQYVGQHVRNVAKNARTCHQNKSNSYFFQNCLIYWSFSATTWNQHHKRIRTKKYIDLTVGRHHPQRPHSAAVPEGWADWNRAASLTCTSWGCFKTIQKEI